MIPTVRSMLVEGGRQWPDRDFVRFETGPEPENWTRGEALAEAAAAAAALAGAGVRQADRVGILCDNGPGWLRTWWGSALLGAVIVPLNTAYRGQVLHDVCSRMDMTRIVVDPGLRGRFEGARPLQQILIDSDQLRGPGRADPPDVDVQPSDIHAVVLTSGTTGLSKGSLTTNRYFEHMARYLTEPETGIGESDVFLADLPFCHMAALAPLTQMLRLGGRVVVRSAPELRRYWGSARECGATFCLVVGSMAEFLMSQPPAPVDTDHSLRLVLASPLPARVDAFRERFGLRAVVTAYGSTESGVPIVNPANLPLRAGSCGRRRTGYQVRIVDEHGRDLPVGEIGEMLVRADDPTVMSQGYLNDDRATATAWRGGWFHTGDMMCVDEDGYLYFHDRNKDAVRRRGENISSFEVEREVVAHPAVAEAACVAAPDELGGDDEVKVYVVPAAGAEVDFEALLRFLVPRMPHFMVPRFYEVIDELPKTVSHRVRKHLLRERGHTPATWDRRASGFEVTRNGLRERAADRPAVRRAPRGGERDAG